MFTFSSYPTFFSAWLLTSAAIAFTPCPLLGPSFPPFKLDPSSKDISSALDNLSKELERQNKEGNGSHGVTYPNTTSFSLALFSTNEGAGSDNEFFFDYHYTAPSLKQSSQIRTVDENSIYRIGGLSQIFTVLTLLSVAGDDILYNPVAKYIPELATYQRDNKTQPSNPHIQWDGITVGELASHMAGIPRDSCIGEPSDEVHSEDGLPVSTASFPLCTSMSYNGTTPLYSNMGFEVLGYIIQKITAQPFGDVLEDRIIKVLGLNGTSLSTPSRSSLGVIPANEKKSGWTTAYGGASPALSMFSSITDLSIVGKAILQSTVLSPAQTRRWLKPVSHTSNPANSLGYPWIIYSGGKYPSTSMVDVYTYYSNIGLYSSYIGIVPDYNVGFAILAADSISSPDLNAHADIISDVLLGTLIGTSTKQASLNFGGLYKAPHINSSLTISADKLPGLFIKEFTSNGHDFRKTLASLSGITKSDDLSIRLYPTGLVSRTNSGSKQTFKAVLQDMTDFADGGTSTCLSWRDVGKLKYNGASLDDFIFEVDEYGAAVNVEVPALEATLQRQSNEG
ncbi:hypothetical protein EYZ11_009147 [Aspergillus tanneri]|uniref:Uncharacterized protein n=1 Tax=Aspergillus tanneri TaxID=1220188 RepID=A0A4S3JAT8_9EURO|nr:hypothetical protein EYZ11_009147 [Aspergillus tanneri]